MTGPDTMDDADLAERIRAACTARVAGVEVDDRPFDADRGRPDGIGSLAVGSALPAAGSRPRGRRLLAAAAVVVVLAALAVAVVATRSGPDRTVPNGPATTSTTGPAPDTPASTDGGVRRMAPSIAPFGLVLSGVDVQDGATARTGRSQLFALTGSSGGKVLVQVGTNRPITSPGATVAVRGTSGSLAHEPGIGRYASEATTTVTWIERGYPVWATAVGVSDEDLLAALDALEVRSDERGDGYAAPAGGPVEALAEVGPWEGDAPTAELVYGSPLAPGSRPGEDRVVTITSSAVQSGELSERYLLTWLYGDRAPDLGDRAVRWYDPATSVVWIGRPGEADLSVQGTGSNGVTEAQLDEIAATVRPVDRAALADLEERWAEQVAQRGPTTQWQATNGATVELRGTFTDPIACLAIDGERRCARPGDQGAIASLVVDGRWYLGVLGSSSPDAREGREAMGANLPTESSRLPAPFQESIAAVVSVPDDVDAVGFWTADGAPLAFVRPSG